MNLTFGQCVLLMVIWFVMKDVFKVMGGIIARLILGNEYEKYRKERTRRFDWREFDRKYRVDDGPESLYGDEEHVNKKIGFVSNELRDS